MDEAEHGRTGLIGFVEGAALHGEHPAIAVDPEGAEVVIAGPAAATGEVDRVAAVGALEKVSGAADVTRKVMVFHESGSLQ